MWKSEVSPGWGARNHVSKKSFFTGRSIKRSEMGRMEGVAVDCEVNTRGTVVGARMCYKFCYLVVFTK